MTKLARWVPIHVRAFAAKAGWVNKADIVQAVKEQTTLTKAEAKEAVEAVIKTIRNSVVKGEKVSISGFGLFQKKLFSARSVVLPRTHERITVPPKSFPTFSASQMFRKEVAVSNS